MSPASNHSIPASSAFARPVSGNLLAGASLAMMFMVAAVWGVPSLQPDLPDMTTFAFRV